MTTTRLISADSHVAVSLGAIRERVPKSMHERFDDADRRAGTHSTSRTRGGRKLSLRGLGHGGDARSRLPGSGRPAGRMDRDGVEAEVLYSEVSAFRAFGLVRGDWRPISRAFTDHLSDFAAHDPDRLAVSYQVPIIDIPYAVSEVERLAGLGARSVHLPNFPSELGLPDYHDSPTTRSGACSRRPGSRSATTSATDPRSGRCFAATRRRSGDLHLVAVPRAR